MKYLILGLLVFLVSCGVKPEPTNDDPKCGAVAKAGQSRTITLGDKTELGTLSKDAQATFQWFPQEDAFSAFSFKTLVSPKVTTVYLLKVKSACGISADFVKVKVVGANGVEIRPKAE